MTGKLKRSARPAHIGETLSRAEIWALLLPILKRVPTYARLAWVLHKEKAIARRHKALLYFTLIYTFTPIHLVTSPIPVVAQVDSLVLLLLGIRQALAHCPEVVMAYHLDRLDLLPRQVEKDLHVAVSLALQALAGIGRPLGKEALFAGKVLRGFGRRLLQRLVLQALGSADSGTTRNKMAEALYK